MIAPINRIIDFSVVDGPGNRTAVFFQGCNFNCRYCHNPETINRYDDCTQMTVQEVAGHVLNNVPFIRGVTCSGGECTLHAKFITELFAQLKENDLNCLLDSNGGVLDFEEEQALMSVTDGVMLDIKATDPDIHKELTGMGNALVLKNARYLASIGKLAELRTVMTKEMLKNAETIREAGRLLTPYLPTSDICYRLIRFRPHGVRDAFRNLGTPNEEEMLHLKHLAENAGFLDVIIT